MSQNQLVKLSLILNYIVFAILLNSVGAVILQVQGTYGISKGDASILEGFKDIPIAIFSFLVASFLPRLGIKKGMLLALGAVAMICFSIPLFANEFWYFKLLFAVVGISFAIIKVSVFATIGLVTKNSAGHSSFMSIIEGFFMVGVLLGNVFFSLFVDDDNPGSKEWLNVYWYLGIMSLLAAALLMYAKLDEGPARTEKFIPSQAFFGMLKLVIRPLVLIFVASAFLFVLIEQSFMTWTPTFYKDVLKVPSSMGIQAGAVLAGAFAVGRLLAGLVLRRVHWLTLTLTCVILVGSFILLNLPLSNNLPERLDTITWFNAPLIVYIFPLIGLFMSPVYPTINSVVLSALPTHMHSSMSGLIVVFSALGGTTGSIITGHLFERFGGTQAFYFSLIPIVLMCFTLILLHKQTQRLVNT